MRQHTHGFHAVFECGTMCIDIHAIRQTAHHEGIGIDFLQIGNETATDVLTHRRDFARAHHVDDTLCVQISVSQIIEDQRSIGAFFQQEGIIVVVEGKASNVTLPRKFHFSFGISDGFIHIAQHFNEFFVCLGNHITNILPMLKDRRGTSHGVVEQTCIHQTESRNARQCHCVNDFLC